MFSGEGTVIFDQKIIFFAKYLSHCADWFTKYQEARIFVPILKNIVLLKKNFFCGFPNFDE